MADEIIIPDEIMKEYADVLPQEEGDGEVSNDTEPEDIAAEEEEIPPTEESENVSGAQEEERTVPLAALRQERAERRRLKDELSKARAITDRLLEATGAASLSDLEAKMDETQRMRVMRERGMDEGTAQMFLDMQRENASLRRNAAARSYDDEVAALSGNPFYDDINDVRDDVEEYARDKNISVKEAYNALFGEQRAQKMQEAARRRAVQERDIKDSKKIKGLSSAGNSPSAEGSLGLTPAELAAAKMAGISPADYKKYKEME